MGDLAADLAEDLDAAFPALVKDMSAQVYWGLRRMSNDHQQAEDLTQETFINAYRSLIRYDGQRIKELRIQPWIWTIALNLGRNSVRDRARRPTHVQLRETPVEAPEPVDDAAWDRRLGELNRHQRRAVVLRHVVGMGIADIAKSTGRAEGTVKADIHRGIAKLRRSLENEK